MSITVAARFTPGALNTLRNAIVDAGGNEVVVLGSLDARGQVETIRVIARGNSTRAPALTHLARPGEVLIHNHPGGRLTPSDADLGVAATLGGHGVATYIVDNAVTAVYAVVEPQPQHPRIALNARDSAAVLQPGGAIAAGLDGYEHRPQQLQMLTAVVGAFNDEAVLTVEAGTGTGKSLAYLLPALHWSVRNRERVIVSTHTINLQEQLVTKDLPFLIDQVGLECSVALVKGRGNYLCRRKAAQIEAQGPQLIEDDVRQELTEVLAWARRSTDGSLADLAVRPRREVWEQVVSENDNCLRARCPFYSNCFFYTARRAAAKADIIVANHHLLMADLSLRDTTASYSQNAVLPPARRVIIDEAHHLEDVATNYFGLRLSYAGLERAFGRLRSTRHESKGLLPATILALESIEAPDDRVVAAAAVRWIEERVLPRRLSLLIDAEQSFTELLTGFEDLLGRAIAPAVEETLRIVPAVQETAYWSLARKTLGRLGAAIGDFVVDLGGICERLDLLSADAGKQILYLATELRSVQTRLESFAVGVQGFLKDDDETCRWIAARQRTSGAAIAFHAAPVEVGTLLRRALFETFASTVLTSATLTVDRRFDYLHSHIGLDALVPAERVQTLRVESPFDFARQAVLAIPRDLPDPNDGRYEAAMQRAIAAALRITDGGTFVLFTAYGALNRAAEALAGELEARGVTLLQQGQANRQQLLRRFVREPRAVLFATDSFWEGVDVRGDALRCVIITRLPFRVPTEPIEQARVEAITRRGGNAFAEHTLPQAVIKLQQGFGRLIRARSDRGAVVLLDSRVVHKAYGRVFLDSLPPARRLIGSQREVFAGLAEFFGRAMT